MFNMNIVFLLLFVSLFSGCATMLHGKTQDVAIHSEPPGATVYCNGTELGNTPLVANIARKQDHTITVVKSGYHAEDVDVKRKLSATSLLYALPGGIVWFSIDNMHGAQFEFPKEITCSLTPLFDSKIIVARELKTLKAITRSVAGNANSLVALKKLDVKNQGSVGGDKVANTL